MNAKAEAPSIHDQIKAKRLEFQRHGARANEANHEVGRLLYQLRRSYGPLKSTLRRKIGDRLDRVAAKTDGGRFSADVSIDPERDYIRLCIFGRVRRGPAPAVRSILRYDEVFALTWGWSVAEGGTPADLRRRLDTYRDIAEAAMKAALAARAP